MEVTLKVRRYDPESDPHTRYQQYRQEVPHYATVLDSLIQVREELDETLALRCSCRSAICGSCAMRINGHARLACKTKVVDLAPHGEEILVEPAGNLPVIKDLVVDMQPFWDRVRAVQPWLQPQGPEPQREYIVPNSAMLKLAEVMNCIMCGACVSDCTVMEVDGAFLGPAALAKALRFVGDPRDAAGRERLRSLSDKGGIWDCTHCFECVEVCPKGVAPMEQILALRVEAMQAGFVDNNGSRHSQAFAESVEDSGRLNEMTLPLKSVGFNPKELLPMMPTGLRMMLHKRPSPIHHSIKGKGKAAVQRIFQKLESQVEGGRK